MQPDLFAQQPNVVPFFQRYPEVYLRVVEQWARLHPALNIQQVRPFLTLQMLGIGPNLRKFYALKLPAEWRYAITDADALAFDRCQHGRALLPLMLPHPPVQFADVTFADLGNRDHVVEVGQVKDRLVSGRFPRVRNRWRCTSMS